MMKYTLTLKEETATIDCYAVWSKNGSTRLILIDGTNYSCLREFGEVERAPEETEGCNTDGETIFQVEFKPFEDVLTETWVLEVTHL